MKSVPRALSALSVAVALVLAGCSSDNSAGGEEDAESGQSAEVPSGAFKDTGELGKFLLGSIDEVEVHRESESNPDFDKDNEADRLHVEFPSKGKPNSDQKATADAVQGAASADFDYDVLMVTGTTDTGTWSYMYSADTVDKLTKDGAVVEADSVWDSADQVYDSVHQ